MIPTAQDRRPGPNLGDTARAADRSGKSKRVASIEGKNAIIGDIPGDASSCSTIADLKRARANGCAAGVSIGASEDRGAGPDLGQISAAGD